LKIRSMGSEKTGHNKQKEKGGFCLLSKANSKKKGRINGREGKGLDGGGGGDESIPSEKGAK